MATRMRVVWPCARASGPTMHMHKDVSCTVVLATLLPTMNNMFAERIPHDVEGYEKALKSLESLLKKLPTTKDSALQKALHTFGEQQTESLRGGKRKKRFSIPIQATARSRKKYKMLGSLV